MRSGQEGATNLNMVLTPRIINFLRHLLVQLKYDFCLFRDDG